MSVLNIADQCKGFNDSYFDFTHFEENLNFLENGTYNGQVKINLLAGKRMQNMREGMGFLIKSLLKKDFSNITRLIVNINSYEYKQISSLNDLGKVVGSLQQLDSFELKLDRHQIYYDEIIQLILDLLKSQYLRKTHLKISDLYFQNQYGIFNLESDQNHQQQSLSINSEMEGKISPSIQQLIGEMENIKHITFYANYQQNCKYNTQVSFLMNFDKGNQLNTFPNQFLSLMFQFSGYDYCECVDLHQGLEKLKNKIIKNHKRLVNFSIS